MLRQGKRVVLSVGLAFSFCFQSAAWAKVEAVIGNVKLASNKNLITDAPTTDESEIIISRKQYVISYNKDRRTPNWVAWKVTTKDFGSSGRSDVFTTDQDLEAYLTQQDGGGQHAVKSNDYVGSCYDRGHQAPSADRSDSTADNQATFMMSNMVPQTPYLNRVIWEHLESYTRDLVRRQGKTVYIIAGPIYDEDFGAIGPRSDIQVPSKEFKIVIALDAGQTLADVNTKTDVISVVMPNVLEDGSRPNDNHNGLCNTINMDTKRGNMDDWQQYKTSLADIQKLSGLKIQLK